MGYLAAFSLFPLLYSLVVAFRTYQPLSNSWTFAGLDNFRAVFSDPVFWEATENTLIFTASAVSLELVIGVGLALFFSLHLPGFGLVRPILVLPMLITPVVVGLMWRALLNPDWGLANWALAHVGVPRIDWFSDPKLALWTLVLVDVWQWMPFVFVVVYARLQALPQEVFEAGRVDGARRLQTFWYITLPLLAPAIVFAGVFRAIDAFRTFDLVFGLTYGGPGRSTTTLSFYSFQSAFTNSRFGFASAIAYAMVIAAVIGTALLFRFVKLRREDAVA